MLLWNMNLCSKKKSIYTYGKYSILNFSIRPECILYGNSAWVGKNHALHFVPSV